MAQRQATDPPYLHRTEWFANKLNKLKNTFGVNAEILDPMGPEAELFRQLNLGNIAAQDIYAQSGTPTILAGASAGTTPPAPVLVTGSNDTRGGITFGTGTTPATGSMVVVTFANPYPVAPFVGIDASTSQAASLQPYVAGVSTTAFAVCFATAPAASQANTVYGINYRVN